MEYEFKTLQGKSSLEIIFLYKIRVGGEIIMAKKRKTSFKKDKKPKKHNNREEVSQELNFEKALKKIEHQNNKINDHP